ncbi:MAG: hypothetical protein LBG13_01840 [Holosporales bacterium]|nr:hypothetical protein [Holosporales bacterium]
MRRIVLMAAGMLVYGIGDSFCSEEGCSHLETETPFGAKNSVDLKVPLGPRNGGVQKRNEKVVDNKGSQKRNDFSFGGSFYSNVEDLFKTGDPGILWWQECKEIHEPLKGAVDDKECREQLGSEGFNRVGEEVDSAGKDELWKRIKDAVDKGEIVRIEIFNGKNALNKLILPLVLRGALQKTIGVLEEVFNEFPYPRNVYLQVENHNINMTDILTALGVSPQYILAISIEIAKILNEAIPLQGKIYYDSWEPTEDGKGGNLFVYLSSSNKVVLDEVIKRASEVIGKVAVGRG